MAIGIVIGPKNKELELNKIFSLVSSIKLLRSSKYSKFKYIQIYPNIFSIWNIFESLYNISPEFY